jgi:hypothetical protein
MKKILAMIGIMCLSACDQGVPTVNDPHNITVNGEKMTQWAFLDKYCVEQVADPTCAKVKHAMHKDDTRRGVPRF